jgi:formyl-CoA transferase
MQVNRGKRSLSLEPTAPEGRDIVKKLIARADIVIANLPDSTLESMELDYARVSAINARVILVGDQCVRQDRARRAQAGLRRHRPGDVGQRVHER